MLGPIPARSQAIARYGDAWVQVAHEGGRVWVRASDLALDTAALAGLPDLRPAPTALPAAPFMAADAAPAAPTAHGTNHARPALERSPAATPVSPFTVC